ncbi:prepilin peptidase, partial [Achromobacter denitrificans]
AAHCPACAAPVSGWRRLPLLGWLLLRGRCAACGTPIGWRYPAIELLTCALFAACAWRFGATPLALCAMGLSATLVALAWIDFESTLLPDALTQPLLWAGLLVNLTDAFATLQMAVAGAVAGYVFLWVIFHVFRLLTGREGMGYGDFKLLAALGAWFGAEALPMLLLSASLLGVLIGGALTLSGRARRGQPLPFGPYLALAGIVTLLAGGQQALWEWLG